MGPQSSYHMALNKILLRPCHSIQRSAACALWHFDILLNLKRTLFFLIKINNRTQFVTCFSNLLLGFVLLFFLYTKSWLLPILYYYDSLDSVYLLLIQSDIRSFLDFYTCMRLIHTVVDENYLKVNFDNSIIIFILFLLFFRFCFLENNCDYPKIKKNKIKINVYRERERGKGSVGGGY